MADVFWMRFLLIGTFSYALFLSGIAVFGFSFSFVLHEFILKSLAVFAKYQAAIYFIFNWRCIVSLSLLFTFKPLFSACNTDFMVSERLFNICLIFRVIFVSKFTDIIW